MAVRPDRMGQTWLFPPSLLDLIPANHICHLVIVIISRLCGKDLNQKYESNPGCPAYPRQMLMRILVQSAIDGVRSSRKIARLCHENVVYMYLSGNAKPDFRTISDFRKSQKDLVSKVFKETVIFSKSAGITTLKHLSTDGTKVKANASNANTLTKEELERIESIIADGIKTDAEEDSIYGDKQGDELPPELDSREKIEKKIEEIKKRDGKKLKQAAKVLIVQHASGDEKNQEAVEKKIQKAKEELEKSGQEAVSMVDPEARFMENKKKRKELSYNPQITVDHGSGIIVANDVTQDCTDHNQLKPQIELTEKNVGPLPENTKISDDNGYYNGENIRYTEQRGFDAYIPDSKQAQKMKGKKLEDNPYSKDKFGYNEKDDCFTCPNGETLPRKGTYKYDGKETHAYYGADCSKCNDKEKCAGKAGKKIITSDGYEAERRRMKAKMETPDARKVYKERGKWAEWPFGNLKRNLGFTEFMTRGILSAKMEHNLVCSAHNLKIIWKKMEMNCSGIVKAMKIAQEIPAV